MARYYIGLTCEELAEITPSMFYALLERRNERMLHERYANAITAAAVYNTNRPKDAEVILPIHLVRATNPAVTQRKEIHRQMQQLIGEMPCNTPREKIMTARARLIKSLTAQGIEDAAGIWAEAWPNLVPQEGEQCR